MLKTVVTLAAVVALAGSAAAGERDRYGPPPAAARYYGPVNNYSGPVTIYAAPDAGGYAAAPASSYPAYGTSYGPGPATAPACDANCYGAGYDGSHGYGYSSGGYAYPASQTPWQELQRSVVGQLDTGAILEGAEKYQRIARRGPPRHNH